MIGAADGFSDCPARYSRSGAQIRIVDLDSARQLVARFALRRGVQELVLDSPRGAIGHARREIQLAYQSIQAKSEPFCLSAER